MNPILKVRRLHRLNDLVGLRAVVREQRERLRGIHTTPKTGLVPPGSRALRRAAERALASVEGRLVRAS